MIPIEGDKNFFRDEKTGAVINCDTYGYDQYIKIKNQKKLQKEEIDQIKKDIGEIKSLLKDLINGSK
jgi:hypothetical protein